jgi:hypothetical protein
MSNRWQNIVSFVKVETKEKSSECTHIHQRSNTVEIAVVYLPQRWWQPFDGRGKESMVEFMQQRIIVLSEVYCKTLKKTLNGGIQNKRHGLLTSSVVLIHDNSCSHKLLACKNCSITSLGSCFTTFLTALMCRLADRNTPGSKQWWVSKAYNLTHICEPTV